MPDKEEVCKVVFKLLHKHAIIPTRATSEAAAMDVHTTTTTTISPGEQQKLETGIAMAMPQGYHTQLQVRSGYALHNRARVEAGLIDSDYRGQIIV